MAIRCCVGAGRFDGYARLAAVLVAVLGVSNGVFGQSLERQVAAAVSNARLGSARVGISVVDVQSGQDLVTIQPGSADQRLFIPASNLKLFTSGAALASLGSSFEFRTQIVQQGDRLIVIGCGDPALGDPLLLDEMKMTADAFLGRIVDSIVQSGASGVTEIILDDRVFDRELIHPEWPADQLNRAYCAPVCGLNFHANVLNVYASPGARIGDQPEVKTDPAAPWIDIDRRPARTVKDGSTQIWIQHGPSPTRFILHGSVRAALVQPAQVTLSEPASVFGRLLADRLSRTKVAAGGSTPTVRLAAPEDPLIALVEGGKVAATVRTPISVILERCNVDSENLYAEALLKFTGNRVTGQAGSWANGTAVVRMQVKDRLGADLASQLVMVDGSGLSRGNKLTPSLTSRWLTSIARDPGIGPMFVQSLALAGEEGTVKRRFKGRDLKNEVRCKSGYIREVRTLSGYVVNPPTGRIIAFSVLVNDVPGGADARAKALHEDIVLLIDDWLAVQTRGGGAAAVEEREAVGG